MSNQLKVNLKASQSFIPYQRSDISTELNIFSGMFGLTETVDLIKDRFVVAYQFDSLLYPGVAGYRAINFGAGSDPGFRWLSLITGFSGGYTAGNTWEYRSIASAAGITPGNPQWNSSYGWDLWETECSISEWYKWGVRKFHIHMPFGKVQKGVFGQTAGSSQSQINALIAAGNTLTPESLVYQIDAYQLCRDGFVDEKGRTGNIPMPWLTNDIVDGITQGFVPLFKALATGTAGDLSEDMWKRLTGIGGPSAWFNPAEPIEFVAYNGGLNQDTFQRWKTLFNRDPEAARARLRESVEPYARAGMRLAIDALVVSPGPIVGDNYNMSDFYKTINPGSGWTLVNTVTGVETAIPTSGLVFPGPIWSEYDYGAKKVYAPNRDANGNPLGASLGETYGSTLDAQWWQYFSGYLVPVFGADRIYSEALPSTYIIGGIGKSNPYLGFSTMGMGAIQRAGYNGNLADTPSTPIPNAFIRSHYLRELGEVEVRYAFSFGEMPFIGITGPNGFIPGDYWFLERFGACGGETSTSGINYPALGANESYLFPARTPGYGYQMSLGYAAADYISRYVSHRNDPTKIEENKTKPIVMVDQYLKRKLSTALLNTELARFGVTLDFHRRFPTINEYANYIGALKNGTQSPDPANPNYGIPSRVIDITPIAKDFAAEVRGMDSVEKISGTMLLYVQSWDAFAGTKLFGLSGDAFYIPNVNVDLEETKFRSWMDTQLASWVQRYGTYPKHIIWNLTEYGFSGKINGEPKGFEMERYFFDPATLPLTSTETPAAYAVRGLPYYGLDGPGITWDGSAQSERFYSRGYDIGRRTPDNSSTVPANPLYLQSRIIILNMIQKAKSWRTERGIPAKIGVYHVPFMPKNPYVVYKVEGAGAAATAVATNAGSWNDYVWPKQKTTWPFGLGGWYTPAETEELKKIIKLEYRKRWEPIVKECESLYPELYNDSCRENIFEDPNVQGWIETHRRVIDLANEFKTINAWSTTDPAPAQQNLPPAGLSASIIPLTAYSVVRPNCSRLSEDDPVVKKNGSLFAHENQEYTLTDWLRDEYLRPPFRRPQKVQGLSMWRGFEYNATNALYTSAYTGREEDREWILKWIQAEDGKGVTIDWNNASDVDTKFRRYLQIINGLTRRYLNRFDKGVPRKDIHDPYYHKPFAAGWNPGVSADGSMVKIYPSSIGGMAITDVVPLLWVGYGPSGQIFRSASNTGGLSNELLTDVKQRASLIPAGKRVVMPWYWQIESPAGQRPMLEYYRATTDGMTYTGTKHRAHETPGTKRFLSPWAYNNTRDAKSSISAFLHQCGATGISFDAIGSDFEAWGWLGLSSNAQGFGGPWGPTGEPATTRTVAVDGVTRDVVVPWDNVYSFYPEPDNRIAPAIVADPRFSGLTNYTTGLSLGGKIEKVYNDMRSLMPTLVAGYGYQNTNGTDEGLTAAQIMDYFIREGPTGISAATGPSSVNAYYDNALQNWQEATRDTSRETGSPWRLPYTNSTYPLGGSKSVSIKLAWFAWQRAIESLVAEDHTQRKWVDTLRGSTSKEMRSVEFAEYDVFPLTVEEGALIRDPYIHPFLALGAAENTEQINASPEQYGSILADSIKTAVYYTNPATDVQKHIITIRDIGSPLPSGTVPFASSFDPYAAKSWIALLMEVSVMRGILRSDPSAWLRYTPWINSPYDNPVYNGFYYTGDPVGAADIERRTYAVQYSRELVFHALLHGAKWFHLFNSIPGSAEVYDLQLRGMTFMQDIINEWSTLTGNRRVRPASNPTGNVNALVERVNLSDAGANHEGATGTLISGARILSADSFGLTASTPFGANPNETYLWRISVPPQGVGCTYDRVDIPGFGSATQDLPQTVFVPPNQTGFWIKRTGNPYKPEYRWRKPTVDGMADLLKNRSFNAIGFPATNPNSVFTGGDGDATVGSGPNSDIRVIAAWKSDPIPFDKSTETTVTVCAYHPSGIARVEASLNGGLTASLVGDSPINSRYQEFTFRIPTGLPQTTEFPTGTLHEIRAKVFPNEGKPRILGGQPTQSSVYYTASTSLMRVAPTKEQANETSYFLCNENPAVAYVDPSALSSGDINMQQSKYRYLRHAILFEMGNNSGPSVLTPDSFGVASNFIPKNKKFLKIKIKDAPKENLLLPILGDNGQIFNQNSVSFEIGLGGASVIFGPATWDLINDFNFSEKVLVIEKDSGSDTPTVLASTYGNTNPPPRPAGFSTAIPGAAAPYPSDSIDNGSRYAVSLVANLINANAYCTFSNRIYRFNRSLLDTTGINEFDGFGVFSPTEINLAPTGLDTNNSSWIFMSGTEEYSTAVSSARSVDCLGIGRIKFKDIVLDRGSILEFTNNRLQFEGVTFTSSLQPPTESRVINAGAVMPSFTGCNIDPQKPTRYGFNGARRVYGCQASNIYTGAFLDNLMVQSSSATGAQQKDIVSDIPLKKSNFSLKNTIYTDISISGTTGERLGVGSELSTGGGAISGVAGACADHEGQLFRNISINYPAAPDKRGMLINGNCHQVFLDGLSFSTENISIDNTYKVVADAMRTENPPISVFGGKAQRLGSTGGSFSLLKFDDTTLAPVIFGTLLGDTFSSSNFSVGVNYNSFGISRTAGSESVPDLSGVKAYIRGIPQGLGTATIPSANAMSLYISGIGNIPTQIGGIIGWTLPQATSITTTTNGSIVSSVTPTTALTTAGNRITVGVTLSTFYGERFISAGLTIEPISGATFHVLPSTFSSGVWNVQNGNIPPTHWLKIGNNGVSWITNPTTNAQTRVKIRSPYDTNPSTQADKGCLVVGPIPTNNTLFISSWNNPSGITGALVIAGETYGLGTAAAAAENSSTTARIPILWASGPSAGLPIWPGSTADFPDFSRGSWKLIYRSGSPVG